MNGLYCHVFQQCYGDGSCPASDSESNSYDSIHMYHIEANYVTSLLERPMLHCTLKCKGMLFQVGCINNIYHV